MVPESFGELIDRLAKQHELEVAAVDALREENQRLSEEIRRLQGSSTEEEIAGVGPCDDTPRKAGTLPNFYSDYAPKNTDTSPSIEEVYPRRRSFPAAIPGMPENLSRPSGGSRRHNTYFAAPLGSERATPEELEEAEQSDPVSNLYQAMPTPAHHRASASSQGLSLHPSPIVPQVVEEDNESEALELPGVPLEGLIGASRNERSQDNHGRATDSMMLLRRGSSLVLERTVADLGNKNLAKQKHRFRHVLDLRGSTVRDEDIVRVMHKRGMGKYTLEQARTVIEELNALEKMVEGSDPLASPPTPANGDKGEHVAIDFDTFVELMTSPDLLVRTHPEAIQELHTLRRMLLPKGADEVIARVTKSTRSASLLSSNSDSKKTLSQNRRMAVLNIVVGITVVMSMLSLGLSMDVAPTWSGWITLEVLFASVFVIEIAIKVYLVGWQDYWWGSGWKWNLCDTVITLLTLLDLCLSLATLSVASGTDIAASKLILVLRALRLTRIARLVKLLHTPILSGLANMLAGFMVGVPCMLWVMVLLTIIFYVLGMVFRQVVGPTQGISRIDYCGFTGDDVQGHSDNAMCQAHVLYGEEFFGTLRTSMFTVFRCVLGDCSSKAGKSLTAAFSSGYGAAFDAVYCGGMVLVVFGLFNIIAAIFVETTISGLKYNNVQRKYARMYESRYVQSKLEALVCRIQELHEVKHPQFEAGGEFVLTEEEFNEVMQDDGVSILLEDLDIVLTNRVGLFDMFDADNNGLVTVAEIVGTLMKVRGEPQKCDMIASWVALRSLNERFQNFERLTFESQKKMLEYQKDILGGGKRESIAVCSGVMSRGFARSLASG